MVGWERKGSFESIPLPDLEVGSNCNELSQQVSPLKRPPCVGFRFVTGPINLPRRQVYGVTFILLLIEFTGVRFVPENEQGGQCSP
jgi:hypothetical protein